jgi:hypothetical protein
MTSGMQLIVSPDSKALAALSNEFIKTNLRVIFDVV